MKNENEREELKKYIYDNFEIEEGTERACTFSLSALTLAAELGYGKAYDDMVESASEDFEEWKELEEQNKLVIEALNEIGNVVSSRGRMIDIAREALQKIKDSK
jgi:hypothetical protein